VVFYLRCHARGPSGMPLAGGQRLLSTLCLAFADRENTLA